MFETFCSWVCVCAAHAHAANDVRSMQVYCTGHSLGGAVASLAAFDIVRELQLPTEHVKVYTFGCPRLGNRAFVREYHEVRHCIRPGAEC